MIYFAQPVDGGPVKTGTTFEVRDVVHVVVHGFPHGLGVVCGVEDTLSCGAILKLHNGFHTQPFHYINAAFCRKVGRVSEEVLAMCQASHDFVAKIDREREARRVP